MEVICQLTFPDHVELAVMTVVRVTSTIHGYNNLHVLALELSYLPHSYKAAEC